MNPKTIAFIYVLFAALWIIYSDKVIAVFANDIQDITFFQTIKGLFYVLISGLLIYWLVNRYDKKIKLGTEFSDKILEHSPLAIAILDLDAHVTYINDQGAEILGFDRSYIVGKKLVDLPFTTSHLNGTVIKKEERLHHRIMSGEQMVSERYLLRFEDGTEKFISSNAAPIKDRNGEIESIVFIVADKTEIIKTESALRDQEERYRLLVNESPFGIGIHQDDEILFVNPAGCELLEAEFDELIGKNLSEVMHADTWEQIRKAREEDLSMVRSYPFVDEFKTKSGKVIPVEVYVADFIYMDKKATQIMAIDITERITREKKLEQTLQEKEVLISEMNHRVKNNMAVISGLLQLQAMQSDDEVLNDHLMDSVSRIQSIAMIHEELYHAKDLKNIRFDKHAKKLVDMISNQFNYVDVDVNFELDKLKININQAVPCALFLNEAVNNVFRHAYSNGKKGEMNILFKNKGNHISILISDNGIGIPAEKIKGSGTGLGMQLLHLMATQLHGELEIISAENNGTKISLEFNTEKKIKGSAASVSI